MVAVLAGNTLGQRRMQDVLPERRALLGLIGVGLALGLDVDRGAVQRGADRAREERAVIVGVVPGEPAFVVSVFPEPGHEFYRVDRGFAVQHDGLAVRFHFLAAP